MNDTETLARLKQEKTEKYKLKRYDIHLHETEIQGSTLRILYERYYCLSRKTNSGSGEKPCLYWIYMEKYDGTNWLGKRGYSQETDTPVCVLNFNYFTDGKYEILYLDDKLKILNGPDLEASHPYSISGTFEIDGSVYAFCEENICDHSHLDQFGDTILDRYVHYEKDDPLLHVYDEERFEGAWDDDLEEVYGVEEEFDGYYSDEWIELTGTAG